ncbi:MAG: hypothetical protein KTR31_20260 [Myxococcales bacterium]|nr:hypothetical protein [Myxococcales bacterium]
MVTILAALAIAPAQGKTLVVDAKNGPFFTVGEAVAVAAPKDVIEIQPGTYDDAVTVTVADLTLVGTDRAGVVLRADNIFSPESGFLLVDGVSITVQDLTITGNSIHRAIRLQGATVEMTGVDLVDGAFSGNGAVVSVDAKSSLTLADVRIENGDAASGRGGLVAVDGELIATGTTFAGGATLRQAGALYCSPTSRCSVTDSVFQGNTAGDGGAVWLEGTPGDWHRNVFCGNDALGGSGIVPGEGGAVWSSVDVAHENSVFQDNRARERGGAVYVESGTVALHNSDFLGNGAWEDGAAIYTGAGAVADVRNVVVGVSTGAATETIVQGSGTVTVSYSAFDRNDKMAEFDGTLGAGVQAHGKATVGIRYVAGDCLATDVRPSATSSLLDAGDPAISDPDGSLSDIGSTGGPNACNRAEQIADGVDEDCDGTERCWTDADGDGFGESIGATVASDDLDCDDEGESSNTDDVCPGFDDRLDCDKDGTPDGCDPDSCEPDDTGEPTGPTDGTPTDGTDRGTSTDGAYSGSGCSCSHPSGPASLGWGLAVLAVLGLRRRGR